MSNKIFTMNEFNNVFKMKKISGILYANIILSESQVENLQYQ